MINAHQFIGHVNNFLLEMSHKIQFVAKKSTLGPIVKLK